MSKLSYDIVYIIQRDYLDFSTFMHFIDAMPEYRNQKLIEKRINENKEDFLFHILIHGHGCFDYIDFKKFTRESFTVNNYNPLSPVNEYGVFNEYNMYGILLELCSEVPEIYQYIDKSCFTKTFFLRDIEVWLDFEIYES